jgi:hypothetical protein
MRKVSRPVRRKEIGDVLRSSNAPISYPTNSVLLKNASLRREAPSRLQTVVGLSQRLWTSSLSSLFQEFKHSFVDYFWSGKGQIMAGLRDQFGLEVRNQLFGAC